MVLEVSRRLLLAGVQEEVEQSKEVLESHGARREGLGFWNEGPEMTPKLLR